MYESDDILNNKNKVFKDSRNKHSLAKCHIADCPCRELHRREQHICRELHRCEQRICRSEWGVGGFLALEKVVLMRVRAPLAVSKVECGSRERRRRLSRFGLWFCLSSVMKLCRYMKICRVNKRVVLKVKSSCRFSPEEETA